MFTFGRYTLVRPIGRGGMAEIGRARLSGPGGFVKHVAIKKVTGYAWRGGLERTWLAR